MITTGIYDSETKISRVMQGDGVEAERQRWIGLINEALHQNTCNSVTFAVLEDILKRGQR